MYVALEKLEILNRKKKIRNFPIEVLVHMLCLYCVYQMYREKSNAKECGDGEIEKRKKKNEC